ncbi:MAG: ribonuclease III [candidate division Zixibacteria bacterium]|nr:ribonuclease III [candidate division Zixibacteria bacterium]
MRFFRKLFSKKNGTIERLEWVIGYRFNDRDLINNALSHRSSLKDTGLESNERLEFLGDAILGLIVSAFLFGKYEDLPEGDLTRMKAMLVNETVLSRAAMSFDLGDFLFLSAEEKKAGGNSRPSITADAFEALLGAVYLDGGFNEAEKLVRKYILQDHTEIIDDKKLHNYKGELLEFMQAKGETVPYYHVRDQIGPDHDKLFVVGVYMDNELLGEGKGKTKKEAEQKAAREAIKTIKQYTR